MRIDPISSNLHKIHKNLQTLQGKDIFRKHLTAWPGFKKILTTAIVKELKELNQNIQKKVLSEKQTDEVLHAVRQINLKECKGSDSSKLPQIVEILEKRGYDLKEAFLTLDAVQILSEYQKIEDRALIAFFSSVVIKQNIKLDKSLTTASEIRDWIKVNHDLIRQIKQLGLYHYRDPTSPAILPPEIGAFVGLESLDLGNNALKSLPSQIGNLKKLRRLELLGNKLIDLPPEFKNLINLEELYLGGNELQSLPLQITELKKLELLNIRHNQLKSLPKEMSKLTNLTYLFAHNNRDLRLPPEMKDMQCRIYLRDTTNFIIPRDDWHL